HKLTEDFLFYVDDIEINDNSRPRGVGEYYLINGDKNTTKLSRDDRYTSAANLNGSADGNQSITTNQQTDKKLYQNCLNKQFTARPGETLTPSLDYEGSWMHGFFYIDLNQNGAFDDNELMAHSSDLSGNVVANKRIPMQSFTLPASTEPGLYRCRFKTDWASKDPAGNNAAGNLITDNGGVIIDVMLNVHSTEVSVNDFQLNGEVLAADGRKLDALKVPFGQPFAIKMNPEKGFFHNGAVIRTGYNLDSERSTDKFGNPQYTVTTIHANQFEDDVYTLPGELMRGNVLINGVMLEDGSTVEPDDAYAINFPEDLKISRTDRKLNALTLTPSVGGASKVINCADNTANLVYINKLTEEVTVEAGATVTPSVNYTGNAMHTYFFVDLDEDGKFTNDLNADGTPAGELLSYSHYEGMNSTGATQTPGIAPDTSFPFVIPAETPAGVYRCRFKIDWNNID
ncbi:MAG: hypothetical protein K2M97_04350, partial [Muribaculaceae bacterium]|nr:hypothetical protein [Muribaculaceae bacterium]